MTEAIFGLLGVLIGSAIPWFQSHWTSKQIEKKNAKYLAIRVVCILDKFIVDCAEVVKDDGLSFGQRTNEGYLSPQVKSPGPPIFPNDVDWTSIDQDLMYKLLSLPSEAEAGDRVINHSNEIASPPDFEDWFQERIFHYSRFGLVAYKLIDELCKKYGIKKMVYNDWDPEQELSHIFNEVTQKRQARIKQYQQFVKDHLG